MGVDIEKVLVSNKISFVEKSYENFIGCLYNDPKQLHIMLPKTRTFCKKLWWTNKVDVVFDWRWWLV